MNGANTPYNYVPHRGTSPTPEIRQRLAELRAEFAGMAAELRRRRISR